MEMPPPPIAPRRGLAIWSLVLGCLGFFSLGLFGLVGVVLGIVVLIRTARDPAVYGGRGLAIAGIAAGVTSLLASAVILTTIVIPRLAAARAHAYELSAIQQISTLHMAQAQYNAQFGRYASNLKELGPASTEAPGPAAADLIPSSLAGGVLGGYRFGLVGNPTGYTIHADPLVYPRTGRRTFFSDQTMMVRENWGPDPASDQSPEIR